MAEQQLSGQSNAQSAPKPTPTLTPSKRHRPFAASKYSRGRSGCLNCRRRRKKCDEGKPACAKCTARGESCEWDTRITFRLSGIDAYHPSMVHSRNAKTHGDYQIMNVTFDDSTGTSQHVYHEQQDTTSQHSSPSSNEHVESDMQRRSSRFNALPNNRQTLGLSPEENSTFSAQSSIVTASPSDSTIEMTDLSSEMAMTPGLSSLDPFNGKTGARVQPVVASSEFQALDYLTSQQNSVLFFASMAQQGASLPCNPRSNSEFMPPPFPIEPALADPPNIPPTYCSNTTFHDLETTLYHHMVQAARNTASTRQASPDLFAQEPPPIVHDVSPSSSNIDEIRTPIREPSLRLQPLESVKLTQRRQLKLWRNYLDEIAVWLDMFDNDRHFQFKIPLLAKGADHLHYSILALSSRHMERTGPGKSYTESLGLYQEAIKLIVKELYTLDITVIASCVLLCVLDMMSSSPRAWSRHLNGCAMLLEAAGVNGVVGGVRQSLFWCFARMDVWGGFLEDTTTKIPTSRWFIPSGSMMEAITHFKTGSGSHSYANYAVFLCASVVNVLSDKTGTNVSQAHVESVESARKTTFLARWEALYELLEDWYNNRPEDMQPLMAYPSNSDETQEPFPIVLYGSSPAVNGNQLYHAATILMLQDKPKGIRLAKSPKSILWHARQICGIAASNSDHGARINSLQTLWIAGKIMSHESEHRAILDVLAEIERDIGWATAWRAEDLKDYWGDARDSEIY